MAPGTPIFVAVARAWINGLSFGGKTTLLVTLALYYGSHTIITNPLYALPFRGAPVTLFCEVRSSVGLHSAISFDCSQAWARTLKVLMVGAQKTVLASHWLVSGRSWRYLSIIFMACLPKGQENLPEHHWLQGYIQCRRIATVCMNHAILNIRRLCS